MAPAKPAWSQEFPLVFFYYLVKSILITVLSIPVLIYRVLLQHYVRLWMPNYGRILGQFDATMMEDYCHKSPEMPMVFTLVLDGSLELPLLQQLFIRNVLEAKLCNKSSGNEDVPRYPELKQFQADFGGYTFWKDDPSFHIGNHICEQRYAESKHASITAIHQEELNKLFKLGRSPWEATLVQNFRNEVNKTLLIFRSHHTLGDTKSILKILVECLGQKKLQLPRVEYLNTSLLHTIRYYALLPFYFVYVQVLGHYVAQREASHPWKLQCGQADLLNVAISEKVEMSRVKQIAKKHGVATSAVLMAAIAGALQKSEGGLAEGLACQYILPKANHPSTLANHNHSAIMEFPMGIASPVARIKACSSAFLTLKASLLHVYRKAVIYQLASWFRPLMQHLVLRSNCPLLHTNIAGDEQGFRIGTFPCTELTLTCGARCVTTCVFSYKGTLQVAVIAKEGVMNKESAQKLVDLILMEFSML